MGASKPFWRRAAAHRVLIGTTIGDLAAVLLVALLAVPAVEQVDTIGFASTFASTTVHHLSAIRGYIGNPLAIFTQRSPGARGSGPLTQTKHSQPKLARAGVKPHEQVLANVRYPSPIPAFVNDLIPNAGPGLMDFAGPGLAIGPGGAIGSTPGIPSPVAPVVVPGGGGGGGGGGSPGGPIAGAVPEPTTWFMLIWGMAMVGFGLRLPQRRLARAKVRIGFRALI